MTRTGFSTEYFCYEHFGYSSRYVDELYDILEDCAKMVHYYLDTSVSYPDDIKAGINKLSMDVDNLNLDFSIAYIHMAKLINEAKKEFMLSKKKKTATEEAKIVSNRIERLSNDLEAIVENTRVHIKKVHTMKPVAV
jgi:flagellar motor switch protein FliM